VTCGSRFPVKGSFSDVPFDVDNGEPIGKMESWGFDAELTLAADGKATLRLVSGQRANVEGFLGTHPIW